MGKKPVLVVMAAGMGSRYGGLKQIDAMGSCGEAILDYSLYDAHEAGFETAVIIIKKAIEADFMETVGKRLKKCPMEIRYVFQELDKIPAGCTVPAGRTKPWGTSHAVLCAKEAIGDARFAVVNADDYYGKAAYREIYQFLCDAEEQREDTCCMVGYSLGNTISEHGSVTRGLCQVDAHGYLTRIVECRSIEKHGGGLRHSFDGGATWAGIAADTPVSMNMWGLTPAFLQYVEEDFPRFFREEVAFNPEKAEALLPITVGRMLRVQKITVKVLRSHDKWFGVTYAAEKPGVVQALREKTARGEYPDGLWK